MSFDVETPQRQLRVPMEMGRINKSSEVLNESLSRLADRLNPVLARPKDENENAKVAGVLAAHNTPLVEQLSDMAAAIERATRRIDDLCARLEI